MTLYLLCTTRTHHEFATANAINDMTHRPDPTGDLRSMGAVAVVPRRIKQTEARDGKAASYDYAPFMPQYIFLAMSDAAWHQTQSAPLYNVNTKGERIILQPPRKVLEILPRSWAECQGFAHRAEIACDRRIEQIERGEAMTRYRKGDKLRILGDVATGQLRPQFAAFIGLTAKGQILAESIGMEVLGKPFKVTLDPGDVEAMAAE